MQKYLTIVMDIRHKITSGEYAQGDRLPTTSELCEQYGVSKITVKRAMDELASGGYVARRRGSGTFVKGIESSSVLMGERSPLHASNGLVPDTEMIGTEVLRVVHNFLVVQPPSDIAKLLDMEVDEFAYYICRTRMVNGAPDRVEHTYMPLKVVPGLRERDAESSLYRYVRDQLGLKIGSAHRAIGAVHPTADEAVWLGVDAQTPLISVRQVGYLDDGTPFEMSTCVHNVGYEFFDVSTQ